MEQCHAYCSARKYDFSSLCEFLEKKYKTVTFKNVLHVKRKMGEAFVFHYGVVVMWGLGYDDSKHLLSELQHFEIGKLDNLIEDEFSYSTEQSELRIHEDHIRLTDNPDCALQKLALSHGIAQSVKLAEFEEYALRTIENNRSIPETLAQTGSTHLSRREIAKKRGTLYLSQSDINLDSDLLDTPEFFWEYPELEPIYRLSAHYLEISQRLAVLNTRLTVIHDLFTMLADERNHQHSAVLEWIIIWLIAIEIGMFLVHDIFKLL